MLEALGASGLSTPAFAARYGVQAQRLYLWRRKLAASGGAATAVTFVEVVGGGDRPARAPARYALVLAGGECLRIEGAIDAGAVRTLLALLAGSRACRASRRRFACTSRRSP